MEVGRVDPGRLMFVGEMGTYASLAPSTPMRASESELSSRSRGTAGGTLPWLQAFVREAWVLRWPWKVGDHQGGLRDLLGAFPGSRA